jgi:hypothetical protein
MSSSRISKNYRSSTQRRKDVVSRIEKVGIQLFDMGRCTACQESGSLCFVLKGLSKCNSCTRKGIQHCDGNFSTDEFDHLEAQKRKLHADAQAKRQEVGRLAAAAAAAYTALARAQQEEVDLSSQIDRYSEAQSRMLRQELHALDELDKSGAPEVAVSTPFGVDDMEAIFRIAGYAPAVGEGVVAGSSGP